MPEVGHRSVPQSALTFRIVVSTAFPRSGSPGQIMKKQRSDTDRRLRQCERLSRLLRTLHLIMGKGRWDADGLAEELECSRRTVYRLLQTLSMAGVPWFFDEQSRAYRVRPGFKFPLIEPDEKRTRSADRSTPEMIALAEKLVHDAEAFIGTLRQFLDAMR